jgi:hypothetical protein
MLPIYIPRNSFWRHAAPSDHYITGCRELDEAYRKYRAGDRLSSSAHLYAMLSGSIAPGAPLALRATSLECLLDAGKIAQGSMLTGGAERGPDIEALQRLAAAAGQPVAPATPSWEERLLSVRWKKRMGDAVDPSLSPWIDLFDAWQHYQHGNSEAAHDVWRRLAYTKDLDPQITGLASLAVVQGATEMLLATRDGAWANQALNAAGWAYTAFSSAKNGGGCAQALLLSGELNYALGKKPMARHELDSANTLFENAGDPSGLAEVKLTGALGEGLTGDIGAVEPALRVAEDSLGERRVPADYVEFLIESARRWPGLIGHTDARPIELRLADARALHRTTSATGDPLLKLISLRALSKLLREASRWSEVSFYDGVRGDLSERYRLAVPFRLRLKRAALLDLDFLMKTQLVERPDHEINRLDFCSLVEAILAEKAATRGAALSQLPNVDLAEAEAGFAQFARVFRTLGERVEQARRQFCQHLSSGDCDAATEFLGEMFVNYDSLRRFLNEVDYTTKLRTQSIQVRQTRSQPGKKKYEIHVNLTAKYSVTEIRRNELEMLQEKTYREAVRDVLMSAVSGGDERYVVRGTDNVVSFYDSYRDFFTPLDFLDEPFNFSGYSVFGGDIPLSTREEARAGLIEAGLDDHSRRCIDSLIQDAMSSDPQAPTDSPDTDNQEKLRARQFFEANWQKDGSGRDIDYHTVEAVEAGDRTALTINHGFTANYVTRRDSEYFTLPERNSNIDYRRRADIVREHADHSVFPAGPPRFDYLLQTLLAEKELRGILNQFLGFNFDQLTQSGWTFSTIIDAGYAALSAVTEADLVARPRAHPFTYWQNQLRADSTVFALTSTLAGMDPTSPDSKQQIQKFVHDLLSHFGTMQAAQGKAHEPHGANSPSAAAREKDPIVGSAQSAQAGEKADSRSVEQVQDLLYAAPILQFVPYRPFLLMLLGDTNAARQVAADLLSRGEQRSVADWLGLAFYFAATADDRNSIEALTRCLSVLRQHGDMSQVFQVEYLLALCCRRAADEDGELKAFRAAIEDLEQLRRSLRTRNQVVALQEVRQSIYQDYVVACCSKDRNADMLSTLHHYKQPSQMPIEALQTEPEQSELRQLVRETTFLYDALTREQIWSPENSIWLKLCAQLFGQAAQSADSRQAVLSGLNYIANVVVDQIRPAARLVGAAEAATPPEGLFISYFVAKQGLYRVTRSRSGKIAARFTPIEEAQLSELCRAFRDAIEQEAEYPCTLHDLLLGELPELAQSEMLYLSPDGALNFIPFQALRDSSGTYLVEHHTLTYVTSPSAMRRRATPGGQRILLVGNPDGSLPGAEEEARAIVKLPGFEAGKPLLQSAATVENVRTRLGEADFVHFATHACANEVDPNFGYLQLADWDRLYSVDLGGLRFLGKHVFLSACETRLGQVLPGEDVYGVADAFLAAGASSVIATLWRIEDESCSLFAQRYYTLLAENRSPPAALALAARDFVRRNVLLERDGNSKALDAPFFWAGFSHLNAALHATGD